MYYAVYVTVHTCIMCIMYVSTHTLTHTPTHTHTLTCTHTYTRHFSTPHAGLQSRPRGQSTATETTPHGEQRSHTGEPRGGVSPGRSLRVWQPWLCEGVAGGWVQPRGGEERERASCHSPGSQEQPCQVRLILCIHVLIVHKINGCVYFLTCY